MSYKDITAGVKVGQARAARFITAKTGSLGIEVSFDFKEPSTGNVEKLTWVGWLSQKAIPFTMKTLVQVLDYNGNDSADENGVLTDPVALNYGKDVSLDVVLEPSQDGTKHYPKIKWINKAGGSAFSNCDPMMIKSKLAESGFRAEFLTAKALLGGKPVIQEDLSMPDLPF